MKKKIIMIGVPHHKNLGDHAMAYAEKRFISENLKEYEYCEVAEESMKKCLKTVKKSVNEDDIICLHGGGNFGCEYFYVEDRRRKVIKLFPNNKIILFPQTIYFKDTEEEKNELEISKKIYSNHKKLTLIAREEESYTIMKENFKDNIVLLTPDIVTYLNESNSNVKREGMLFILRNDIEKNISDSELEKLDAIVKNEMKLIEYTDTLKKDCIPSEKREETLLGMFGKIKSKRIVITDRLHGMIFCAITSTPCIVVKNYNHKITSSYKWFEKFPYMKLIENIEDVKKHIKDLSEIRNTKYDNSFAKERFRQIIDIVNN